jgi:cytochrome P450
VQAILEPDYGDQEPIGLEDPHARQQRRRVGGRLDDLPTAQRERAVAAGREPYQGGLPILKGGPGAHHHYPVRDLPLARFAVMPPRTGDVALRLADRLIDTLAAEGMPADLHGQLSVPLPMLVICELVGAPAEDGDRLREWTQRIADQTSRPGSEAARDELIAYIRRLVTRKRAAPADDLVSRLCAADDGTLSDAYVAFLAAVILFAGHENTVVKIDYGALLMLQYPAQRQLLAEQPDLLDNAVEEILRAGTSGIGGGMIRYAREDLTVGGVGIRAGDLVLLDLGAANRDHAVFTDPDRFQVDRCPSEHLTFGHGPHYCLGAPLARAELRAVFGRLFRRLPGMRLAVPFDQLEVRTDLVTGGLASLPVTW